MSMHCTGLPRLHQIWEKMKMNEEDAAARHTLLFINPALAYSPLLTSACSTTGRDCIRAEGSLLP